MRVVLTGISGIGKENFLNRIQTLCNLKDLAKSGADPDVSLDQTSFDAAQLDLKFDWEHEMCEIEKFKTPNYLDIAEGELLNAKNKALDKIINDSEGKKNVILAMHAVYYRRSSLFTVLDWKRLGQFKPEVFITLIDDVYSIKKRIKGNKHAGAVKYISLKDILWWREAEFLVTREIARNMSDEDLPHYLIALEQTPTTIYQLMFELNKKKVYASYPVTSAKSDPNLFKETSEFLTKLKKHFIVFDPMTIREKLLQDALLENLRAPHPEPFLRIKGRSDEKEQECSVNEVLPIISDINGQIVSRDRRLVTQSDLVIGYRPNLSLGAQYELTLARDTARIETFVVCKPEDSQSPFISELAEKTYPTVEDLLPTLRDKGYIRSE